MDFDFEQLGQRLLADIQNLLPRWLPGGRLVGHEWSCGSLRGEQGDSLKVNINTGKWADFAGDEKGGDLISLYAAIQGISQGDAFRELSESTDWTAPAPTEKKPSEPAVDLVPPPPDIPPPAMTHQKHGAPSMSWCYRDKDGQPLFYIARYDTPDGKQIVPWSWLSSGRWIAKGWPAPRPLYGLDLLALSPALPVMIVEGEKAADAARQFCGRVYVVVSWPNGGKAVNKTDWTPLYGRKVLIWPDADEPGYKAAAAIAGILLDKCPEVKVLRPDAGPDNAPSEGWDAYDALLAGWNWDRFKDWAKPIAEIITRPAAPNKKIDREPSDKTVVAVQVNAGEDTAGFLNESQYALCERLGLAVAGNGKPICNMSNVVRVFSGIDEYKELVWYDEFHRRYFTKWRTGVVREWNDIDDLNLTSELQGAIGLHRVSDEMVSKAVRLLGHQHVKNEPRDWLDTLVWDGTDRIAEFLTACMGVDPSDYARSASRNFWIGMVARIYRPGCQLDNMIVLEGAQGIGKTRALRAIGGPWYTSSKESVSKNDFFMALNGKLVVEIAELDSFSRAEVTRIKQVISDPMDRYRAPYDRRPADHLRMSIFVGTTNEDNYLRDTTGGRRFWPVKCTEINLEFLTQHRTQFFAEAVHRFKAGETWYEMPAEATKLEQESRRQVDEWEHIINGFLSAPTLAARDSITVFEIATECLKIEPAKLDKPTQIRIAGTLKALGWSKKLAYGGGEKRVRAWVRPEKTQIDTNVEVEF